jgi:hypothetical protein
VSSRVSGCRRAGPANGGTDAYRPIPSQLKDSEVPRLVETIKKNKAYVAKACKPANVAMPGQLN